MSQLTLKRRKSNGDLIPSLRNDLSEFFDIDRFFNRPVFETPFFSNDRFARIPATNICENKDEYCVELAAPGMKKNDFKIDIDNGVLEIKVEKESKKEEGDKEYTRKEYDYTMFYRSFDLPESVNSEKIKAEYKDGILSVHLPKVAEPKKKQVKEIAVL